MNNRLPQRADLGRNVDSSVEWYLNHYEKHLELLEAGKALDSSVSDQYVCGYPVPPFQRPLCWSNEQQVAFIESVWMELPIGSLTIHAVDWDEELNDELKCDVLPMSAWVIDGLQRLFTLQNFFDSKLKINGLYWSDLTRAEKRRFEQVKFTHNRVSLWDESIVKDLYNRMNFGGTNHTLDQVAV
ncbi:DUF262 domain-containing protein [Psychromonas sp. Urea-02u-13]|uniref:DUF262 domain-containing protein n=1 Tax=Psychromonas sp. Urea-02u-13 TaxID=2058326 RepID=UPI000C3404FB|nr:DUF262 domain-containing protein [Psychromonas sp. Urea-02u-13]PKG37337.1 hypothetical protein CXF74_19405 [Psychromonas sp. Urea-02u-13]